MPEASWVTFPWSVAATPEGRAGLSSGWVDPTSVHSTPQPGTGKGGPAWLQEPGVLAGVYVRDSMRVVTSVIS